MNNHAVRISRTVAVAVAGMAVGLGATIAVASGDGTDTSPKSYDATQRAAIAQWAIEHQLSGLSPASLTPTRTAEDTSGPRLAAEMRAIANYAREHQLSGLSPASLQPIGD